MPQVCATITAATTAELRRKRDHVRGADLVELRLDSVADPDVAGALAGRQLPAIVTCRPKWEGGEFAGSEEARHRLLADAVALGAEYIDLEWKAGFDDLVAAAADRVVMSSHDFDGVPADVSGRIQAMRATGARVVKLAARANRLTDCLTLMTAGTTAAKAGPTVVIAMGDRGIVSRVLAARFGAAWTYAGTLSGVGQLNTATLLDEYNFRSVHGDTEVYGLVGSPIGHSVSPAMHNAAFRSLDINGVYVPLAAADVNDFLTFAKGLGVKGASVTIPYKVALAEHMDELDAVARRVGAINTIKVSGGRWLGGNTDSSGFLAPLHDRRIPLAGKRAAILGAGGAARAVAIALAPSGAAVTIHARDRAKASAVAMIVSGRSAGWPPEPGSWDILINCTPVGMHPRPEATPVAATQLTGAVVYDLIYNPATTRLLREAEVAGCRTIGGLEMLVAQAHDQFLWWTGMRPIPGVMRNAALRRLAEFSADENHVI